MFRLFYTSIFFLLLYVPVKLHGMGIFQILLNCTYFFCLGILTLEDDTTKRQGLMSELSLQCNTCHESTPLLTSTSVTQRGTSYDTDQPSSRVSCHSVSGYEGLAAFSSIMNMPCLTKTAYYKQVDNVLEALEDEAKEEMRKSAERLRQHILDENPEKDENDILAAAVSFDVAVSFDGT